MSSSTAAVSSSTVSSSSSERFIGRVKWFNNKAGYGFVTVTDGPKSGSDVFVHHSSIQVDSEQYKYLVQGEYVEFSLSDTKTGDHEYQAGDVSGIKGGKLMCETRRDLRVARSTYKSSRPDAQQEETLEPIKMPRSVRTPREQVHNAEPKTPRVRGAGPREEGEWTQVVRSKKSDQDDRKPSAGRGRGRPPRSKEAK